MHRNRRFENDLIAFALFSQSIVRSDPAAEGLQRVTRGLDQSSADYGIGCSRIRGTQNAQFYAPQN